MQKEKSVRTYQRKSKNGKVVTVHAYKAKYDVAEEARKEMAKRAGAGDELKKKKSAALADLGFTADEFKIWANDLDAKEAKRIDKILVKKYGEKAVQKLADEINAGNSRTHKAVFARLTSESVKKTNHELITRAAKGDKKAADEYYSRSRKIAEDTERAIAKEERKKSKAKNSESTLEHYDQLNKKYTGKKVGEPFKFSDDGGSYDAHFVTDGKGRYGYVVRDADDPKGKFYVGIDDGTPHKKVLAAAKKAGLSFDKKSGKFIKMDKTVDDFLSGKDISKQLVKSKTKMPQHTDENPKTVGPSRMKNGKVVGDKSAQTAQKLSDDVEKWSSSGVEKTAEGYVVPAAKGKGSVVFDSKKEATAYLQKMRDAADNKLSEFLKSRNSKTPKSKKVR